MRLSGTKYPSSSVDDLHPNAHLISFPTHLTSLPTIHLVPGVQQAPSAPRVGRGEGNSAEHWRAGLRGWGRRQVLICPCSLHSSSRCYCCDCCPWGTGSLQQPHYLGFVRIAPSALFTPPSPPHSICYWVQDCDCHGKDSPREHHSALPLSPQIYYWVRGCTCLAPTARQNRAIPTMAKIPGVWRQLSCPLKDNAWG